MVERHRVTLLGISPTAIRALMRDGEGPVKNTSRASLRSNASNVRLPSSMYRTRWLKIVRFRGFVMKSVAPCSYAPAIASASSKPVLMRIGRRLP